MTRGHRHGDTKRSNGGCRKRNVSGLTGSEEELGKGGVSVFSAETIWGPTQPQTHQGSRLLDLKQKCGIQLLALASSPLKINIK